MQRGVCERLARDSRDVRGRRTLQLVAAALSVVTAPVLAQGPSGERRAGYAMVLPIVGGILGSALGQVAGAGLGSQASKTFNIDRNGDDPGLTMAIVGGVSGSLAGTVAGVRIGSIANRSQPSLERRLRDAGVGLALGIGAGFLVGRISGDDRVARVTYSLVQGTYAGLSNGRW